MRKNEKNQSLQTEINRRGLKMRSRKSETEISDERHDRRIWQFER
jgi:hypothetical protein